MSASKKCYCKANATIYTRHIKSAIEKSKFTKYALNSDQKEN